MQSRELPYRFLFSLLTLAVAAAVFLHQPLLMLTAPVAVLLLHLTGAPRALLLFLWFSIPWSMEVQLTPSLGTDFPDEPLMWLTTLVIVVMMFQSPQRMAELISHPIMIWIALLWCWACISTMATSGGWLSVKYLLAKLWFIVPFTCGSYLLLDGADTRRKAFTVIAIPMIILAGVTLFRHAFTGFSFAEVSNVCAPYFRNHVNYGALLVCTLPMVWMLHRVTRNPWWIVGLVILLIALYFSYSRGAWLALPVGVLAVWFMRKRLLVYVMVFVVLVVTAVSIWLIQDNQYLRYRPDYSSTIYHAALGDHIEATYAMKDLSTAERFYRWIAGWRMAEAHPLTGVGPNHFYPAYRSYTVAAYRTYVSSNPERSTVHNYFLLLLSEQGFPALILFVVLLFTMFAYAQNAYHRSTNTEDRFLLQALTAMLAMVVILISLSDLIEADKIGSLFYIIAGLLIGMTSGAHIQRVSQSIAEQVKG
jgi:O-antigen ligase